MTGPHWARYRSSTRAALSTPGFCGIPRRKLAAGYIVEALFGMLHLVPTTRSATVVEAGFSWNYTTWLNLAFLVLTTVLLLRFVRTGGIPMLRMMGGAPPPSEAGHTRGEHQR